MNAPNRWNEIQEIWSRLMLKPITDDAARIENVKVFIVELNRVDGGKWGFLCKTDQGNKIPTDIICWKDTLEHIDVLNGSTGLPTWQYNQPPTNPKWIWKEYTPSIPPDIPDDDENDVDLLELIKPLLDKLDTATASLDALTAKIDELNKNGIKVKFSLR